MRTKHEIENIRSDIKLLSKRIDNIMEELRKQFILSPHYIAPEDRSLPISVERKISIPALQDKLNAILDRLNLEYKEKEAHYD